MADYDMHHYVPRFLLQGWVGQKDGKLSTFRWVNGNRFISGRHSPKAVAKLFGLYALKGVEDINCIEKEFFTKRVDIPGSDAYHAMLENGVDSLDEYQKSAWAKFIVSLLARGPDTVKKMHDLGPKLLRKQWHSDCQAGIVLPEPTEWDLANVAPESLPGLIDSPKLNNVVVNAVWKVRKIDKANVDLLISDKPVTFYIDDIGSSLIALPLTPRQIFLAYSNLKTGQRLSQTSDDALCRENNRRTVSEAMQYVFARDERPRKFIQKYLIST